MSTKNGGPAFPRPAGWTGLSHADEHECNSANEGMTLRDWFAGMALQGLVNSAVFSSENDLARMAYQHADAMLEARDNKL